MQPFRSSLVSDHAALNNFATGLAVHQLARGEVLAYPTEAVWGLGCDPWRRSAVLKLLGLKNRPVAKGLILVAADIRQFDFLLDSLDLPYDAEMRASWPGPVSWLVPAPPTLIPAWIRGAHNSVAIRVSDHPLVQALCWAWGGPIVSTSANPHARRAAKTALQVRRYFGHNVRYVAGAVGGRKNPSEIRDSRTGAIIRPA